MEQLSDKKSIRLFSILQEQNSDTGVVVLVKAATFSDFDTSKAAFQVVSRTTNTANSDYLFISGGSWKAFAMFVLMMQCSLLLKVWMVSCLTYVTCLTLRGLLMAWSLAS